MSSPDGRSDDSADGLDTRLEFETLVVDLSSRFINLPPGEVDREIEESLRRVCEFLGIDLAVLWQWSTGPVRTVSPTHAYPAVRVPPAPDPVTEQQYPWTVREMEAGRTVIVSSLGELPLEAVADRESARGAGIKSSLVLPLVVGGELPLGAVAFNTLRTERDWPEPLVNRLRLVAQIFANALARRRADESLRESEQRLSLAVDAAQAGLWTFDYSTGVFWASDRSRAIFGFAPDDVITMEVLRALVVPEDWPLVAGAVDQAAATGQFVDIEYRFNYRGESRPRWVTARGEPSFHPDGSPDRLAGICFDATEQRRANEAMRTSEARLAAGAELAGLGFHEIDYVAGVMFIDDRARDLLGLPGGAHQGLEGVQFWREHVHPSDAPIVSERRRQLHAGTIERLSMEYRYLHPTRGERWIQHQARVEMGDPSGRALKTYGVLRDISDLKRAEEEMRELSRRLIRVQEDERALLARELHDDVTQRLAVMAIDVGRAEAAAPGSPMSSGFRALREELVRLSEDIHSLAYQLHPSVLEELGLAEALRAECERRGRQSRLDISLDLDAVPAGLGKDPALCLFRVAQEALGNVLRHAEAQAVILTLRQMEGGLLLAVKDDGVGFDPKRPGGRRRLGLASMRERMRLADGMLDIESAPGHGTTVIAWVPLHGEPE